MKKIIALLLCMCLLVGIVACSGNKESKTGTDNTGKSDSTAKTGDSGKQDTGSVEYKDTITIVTIREPDTLDPRRGNSVSNNVVMNLVYDALVALDENREPQPRLAESWEFVDDTHLRIKLKKDVKFSNGNPFNADDVLYCLERTLHDPTSKSTMSWYDPANSVKEDDHTVVLAMHHPYAPVFWVLSGWRCWMGDKETMEEMGEEAHARSPIGTGPYKLSEWTAGSSLKMTRNDNYWGEAAKTENVLFKFIAEPANRVIELETNASDIAYYISGNDRQRVDDLDGFHIESGISEQYYLVTLAMNNEKFKDKRVREALSLAIDCTQLTEVAFDKKAHVMKGVIPSIAEGFKDKGGFEYNPDRAKELLKEAGYENGLELELHILPGSEYQRMAEIIQAYWEKIGVKAKIEQSELATREAQGPWEAAIRTATADEISNILIIYEKSFGSRLAPNDEHLEEMLQRLKQTYGKEDRAKLLGEIQDYIYDIRFSIPFAEVDTVFGVSDKIEGFKFTTRIALLNIPEWRVVK